MHEDPSSLWLFLQLDPGTAAFLGLPERLPLPVTSAASLFEGSRPSLAALAEGLETAIARDANLAADPAILRFLRRWPRYADLERYLGMGNATFARTVARSLLADDPTDPPALAALSLLAAQEGDWEGSLKLLAPLRERAPDHPVSRLQVALSLAGAGRPEESLAEFTLLLSTRVQSLARLWSYEVRRLGPEALSERVRQAFRTQLAAGTEGPAGWKALETAFPENPEVLFGMSQDLATAPDDTAREALLRRALVADPDHPGATVALAEVLRVRGRVKDSRDLLLVFLAREPESRPGRVALGEALEQMGGVAEARDAYRRVLSPPWAEIPSPALLAAGHGLLRLRDHDTLHRCLEEAMRERPPDPAVYQILARLLERTGSEEMAERRLRDGLVACGPRPALLYALGDLLRRMDRRHESEGLMKALVERHPGSPWGYRGLGDLLVETDAAKALEHYARAIERDPVTPIPGVEYLRGLTALRAGDPSQARIRFERAAAYEPSNARVWCDLGAAYFQEDRLEAALRATERALALRPEQPGFLHNLAVYHAERFRRRPWRHPLSAWHAWRLRRRAARSGASGWRHDLWRPAPGAEPSRNVPPAEAPPDT